ncbi:MAG: MBL fold metallo-hydrolase RNA specificity domain-containing protein [Omnitrophica WOR_2 bacterium]
MGLNLHFLGAAGTVTGSRHLFETGGRQYLVDCGLFQGSHELDEQNWEPFPVPPEKIDAIFLTHAHIDHTGYLPHLLRDGYQGPIYATEATCALLDIVLPDSAHLQEQEAQYANKKGYSRYKPALPLYTIAEAERVLKMVRVVPFHKPLKINDITVTWRPAGHILGSAYIQVDIEGKGHPTRVVFSGDLGRYGQEVMKPPYPIDQADYLLVESTYGDRLHTEESIQDVLEKIIQEVIARSGVLLIPAFAIGRTQIVLYHLRRLQDQGRIPNLPVYVDSPMAVDASEIYHRFGEDHNLDANLLGDEDQNPLRTRNTRFIREVEASKKLNTTPGPAVIISASGMANGGRIMHHLKWRLPDSRNTVLFVGYQAEGTRGRMLLDGARKITIHGEKVPVRAKIERVDALSSHADYREILTWLKGIHQAPKATFIIHGEPEASRALQGHIESELGWQPTIPHQGEVFQS